MTAPNNPLPPLPPGATPALVTSIRQAARATNIDFGLLMAQAQQESDFRPDAKAAGSTATGLYQFIDATWLGLVRQFGGKYGIGDLARQITIDAGGRVGVADPALRQRILDLRNDPSLSAALAAEFARQNKLGLEPALGRPAGNADLYMAHFLGVGGATGFLKALQSAGAAPAAQLLPAAAAANPAVFFDGNGRERTVAQVYQLFSSRIEDEAQRFAGAPPASAVPSATSGAAAASEPAGAYISRLPFDAHKLSPPMAAMLNVFALSALKLLEGPSFSPVHPGTSTHRLL